MVIPLDDGEAVRRGGERYEIGDKVYSQGRAGFGVGYIEEIEVLGVHFGFRAKVRHKTPLLESPTWVDARNLTKEPPLTQDDVDDELIS